MFNWKKTDRFLARLLAGLVIGVTVVGLTLGHAALNVQAFA